MRNRPNRNVLLQRVRGFLLRYGRMLSREYRAMHRIGGGDPMDALRKKAYAGRRAQWRRWYKANRKYQRQIRALRQLGGRCHPNLSSLKREMVP